MSDRAVHIQTEAARLFAERGYGATSIDDIGTAAGISGPAIYWHFPGKQALLAAMLTDIAQRQLADAIRCIAESPPASGGATASADPVRRLVEAQVAFAMREPHLIVVHGRDLHHLDRSQSQRVKLLQRQYLDVWVGALAPAHPDVGSDVLGAAVRAVIELINSIAHLGRADRALLRPILTRMALGSLASIADPPR